LKPSNDYAPRKKKRTNGGEISKKEGTPHETEQSPFRGAHLSHTPGGGEKLEERHSIGGGKKHSRPPTAASWKIPPGTEKTRTPEVRKKPKKPGKADYIQEIASAG